MRQTRKNSAEIPGQEPHAAEVGRRAVECCRRPSRALGSFVIFFALIRFGAVGQDDVSKTKNGQRFGGIQLFASARGSAYAGFLPTGLPCLMAQVAGERILVAMDLQEALECYCTSKGLSPDVLEPQNQNLPCLKDRESVGSRKLQLTCLAVVNCVPCPTTPTTRPGRHDDAFQG